MENHFLTVYLPNGALTQCWVQNNQLILKKHCKKFKNETSETFSFHPDDTLKESEAFWVYFTKI